MTLLVITPDYASHYLPLSAIADVWRRQGGRVVVACGTGLERRVREDGFDHVHLPLGAGNNPGLIRPAEQASDEAQRLRGFFAATRKGMAATLRYQAEVRRHDLLWRPVGVARRLEEIVAEVRPHAVISDQISFNATVGLKALGIPYASFVPGHPTSVPVRDETYGYAHLYPPGFEAPPAEMKALRHYCQRVAEEFTDEFNRALSAIAPTVGPVEDAFAVTSPWLTLFNYPRQLVADRPAGELGATHWLGSTVRPESLDAELAGWLVASDDKRPTIYVSFGSFLSAREDALRRVVAALKKRPWRVILATGIAAPENLGELPAEWLIRPYLPQVAVLDACDAVITHGGNNTMTETLSAGLPMVVGPFSTDQFAGAETLRKNGLAAVFDPNRSTSAEITRAVERVLTDPYRQRVSTLGVTLRARPGAETAVTLLGDLVESCVA